MDATAFQNQIKTWRLRAGLNQAELDEKCGFKPGTVARLEQGKTSVTDEQLVKIMLLTDQDILWALTEALSITYRRMYTLEQTWRQKLDLKRTPHRLDQDTEYSASVRLWMDNAFTMIQKQQWATDRWTYMHNIFVEMADRVAPEADPPRARVKRTKKKASDKAGS